MAANTNLQKAKASKNDEFYTKFEDVTKELSHYTKYFKDKTVFCNCDDPTWSAFWKYFHINFKNLGLKRLVSTHYDKNKSSYKMIYDGGDDDNVQFGTKTPLDGEGDFRSDECVEILKESDIVVTNPPFSIAREYYIPQLFEFKKEFIIVGDLNWATYKTIFPLLKEDKMWFGYNSIKEFMQPDGTTKKFGNKLWFTNLDNIKRHTPITLVKTYNPDEYPTYINCNAINIDRISDIPKDYDGIMGVPVSFFNVYNPEQFKIIGFDQSHRTPIQNCGLPKGTYTPGGSRLYIKESDSWYRMCYARILIQKRKL